MNGAERVRDEIRGDDLHAVVARDLVEVGKVRIAVLVDPQHQELSALPLRDVLPRHEVRVVLELGDDDGVAGAEVVATPRVRDQVQALRGVADEDHFPRIRRVDERSHLLARAFEPTRRPLREHVHGAVDVRV